MKGTIREGECAGEGEKGNVEGVLDRWLVSRRFLV